MVCGTGHRTVNDFNGACGKYKECGTSGSEVIKQSEGCIVYEGCGLYTPHRDMLNNGTG